MLWPGHKHTFNGSEEHNGSGSFCGTQGHAHATWFRAIRHLFTMQPGPAATAASMRPMAAHVAHWSTCVCDTAWLCSLESFFDYIPSRVGPRTALNNIASVRPRHLGCSLAMQLGALCRLPQFVVLCPSCCRLPPMGVFLLPWTDGTELQCDCKWRWQPVSVACRVQACPQVGSGKPLEVEGEIEHE